MASTSTYAFFHCHYAFQKFPFFCVTLCVLHAPQNAILSHSAVIDIALGFFGLLQNFIGWEVSSEPSLSYYRHILFTLQGSVPVSFVRNPSTTNWGSYIGDLRDRLERAQRWI